MNRFIVMSLICIVCFAGCAKLPTVELEMAQASVDAVIAEGAEEYAPEVLANVQSSMAQVSAEVEVQNKKFALVRSYKNAKVLALSTKKIADDGIVVVKENKEIARKAALTAIESAKLSIMSANNLVLTAPTGKGSELDIQLIKSDISGLEQLILDASSEYELSRFNSATTKAQSIKASADGIIADINNAISLKNR